MATFRFDLHSLPPEAESLRAEVRDFLAHALRDFPAEKRARTWFGHDEDFTREVAGRGWIGMTWPQAYGGQEKSFLERFVVLEEMLAAGAPVAAHWMADRQSGPLLLRFGTEEQKQSILPGICRGEIYFCIGMSEPDSGSDLASVRSRAEQTASGWRLQGTKLWTSGAATAHYMVGLFRSGRDTERQAGLSQFLIPMAISLAFGVLFATPVTLLLVPSLYLAMTDVKQAVSELPARLWGDRETPANQE